MPVSVWADDIADVLGPSGLLARRPGGFGHRPQQQAMAAAVAEVIEQAGTMICEAGTGTGKTFAYLVPALLCERKVVISTGTRNLQDQLFHRDLPLMREVMGVPRRVTLLKGRGNYLCLHRLDRADADVGRLRPEIRAQLPRVRAWAAATRDGDIAEVPIPENAAVWPLVTSTADNCLGQDCPAFGQCHFVAARRRAQEADLVVINHHLLCADMALRDEGFGEVLPGADAFIVDEAHQLPEVAGSFFGLSVSGRQLQDLAQDIKTEYAREAGDVPEIPDRAGRLRRAAQDLRLSLGVEDRRGPWQEIADNADVEDALDALQDALQRVGDALAAISGRGKGLDQCHARVIETAHRLETLISGEAQDQVRWFDVQGQGFRLNQTPLDVAEIFKAHRARQPAAWVFTSATLAVGDSFKHFSLQMGIDDARTERWESPFDYPHQALWFVPRGLPDPGDQAYGAHVAALARETLELSRGRAFLLFTSHRALHEAEGLLKTQLDFPLLVQGSAPRAELIERFRELGNAVLLGTSSFWEGVDVRGEALSCVIIDKLPFASPGDPILQARADALRRRGGNPFRDYQLPQAVIALKQGAGRLIRDATDRGVLVVCDPRLLGRGYGHAFLKSLPPMARTRDIDDVRRFFAEGEAATA